MKFAEFMFFSSIELIAFSFFVLILFRFNMKENIVKFIIFSIILSLVSNTLQIESLQTISSLLQVSLLIFFVTYVLNVHLFNSFIVVLTGYIVNFIVQWIITGTTFYFSDLTVIEPYTQNAYIIQTASACVMVLLGCITYIQKGGFSFIDNRSRFIRNKFFVKENRLFILFFCISLCVIILASLLFVLSKNPPYLLVSILLLITLMGLIYISIKRDGNSNG